MNLDRRTFIKGTAVGVASLATGLLPSIASADKTPIQEVVDGPLSDEIIAYWHAHMVEFIKKHGSNNFVSWMPIEPTWEIVEQGWLNWTTPMPYPNLLYKDVKHLQGDVPFCAYSYAIADTSFGRLRTDHFFKDTFHHKFEDVTLVESGDLRIVSLNGKHLGYWGLTEVPRNFTLNFSGLPVGDQLLLVGGRGRGQYNIHETPFRLWKMA